jgi:hypothetical protein
MESRVSLNLVIYPFRELAGFYTGIAAAFNARSNAPTDGAQPGPYTQRRGRSLAGQGDFLA